MRIALINILNCILYNEESHQQNCDKIEKMQKSCSKNV